MTVEMMSVTSKNRWTDPNYTTKPLNLTHKNALAALSCWMQLLWKAHMQLLLQKMLIEIQQIIEHVFVFGQTVKILHLEALQKLPSDHPWCQPILQLWKGMTNRTRALRYSIAYHLHLKDEDKEKEALFIHCHHFSIASWMAPIKAKNCA
jgi:hypothetical protein